jgi:uncharacterized membrane-anchored protein YhcB (DUF1043 family)
MAEIDAQKVISRLAAKLANCIAQQSVLETQLDDTQAELDQARIQLAEARTELAKLHPLDA